MEQDYSYWSVKVKIRTETDSGRIKYSTESYLVNAVSPTDAEVVIAEEFKSYPNDWHISGVTQTKYVKVLNSK